MKILGYLFIGFLILGLVAAAIKALIVALLIAFVISLIVRPLQTLGMLSSFVVLGVVTRYPFPGIILVSALCIAGAMSCGNSKDA